MQLTALQVIVLNINLPGRQEYRKDAVQRVSHSLYSLNNVVQNLAIEGKEKLQEA